jgi:NAD-dependent DNA ligase
MLGISEATITKLFEAGKVTCISDLYTLTEEDIMSEFKQKLADDNDRIEI